MRPLWDGRRELLSLSNLSFQDQRQEHQPQCKGKKGIKEWTYQEYKGSKEINL